MHACSCYSVQNASALCRHRLITFRWSDEHRVAHVLHATTRSNEMWNSTWTTLCRHAHDQSHYHNETLIKRSTLISRLQLLNKSNWKTCLEMKSRHWFLVETVWPNQKQKQRHRLNRSPTYPAITGKATTDFLFKPYGRIKNKSSVINSTGHLPT